MIRLLSVIVGIAVSVYFGRVSGYSLLFSLSLGFIALLAVHFGWFIFERSRKARNETDEVTREARGQERRED